MATLELPESIAFDYELLHKIGEGSCGETWLLQHRIDNTPLVLKFLKMQFVGDFKALELRGRASSKRESTGNS